MPMKVQRPTRSPPSTDSSRNASGSAAARRRKADTGVSRSAVIVRYTGTRVWLLASVLKSRGEGRELAVAFGIDGYIINVRFRAYSARIQYRGMRRDGRWLPIVFAEAY